MTEIEASILLNQAMIMMALALLTPKPLDEQLLIKAEEVQEYVKELMT